VTEDEGIRREIYERETGDNEDWGEPVAPKPRRRLGAMVSVRLTPDELERVREAAEARGMSTSAFLREVALQAAGAAEPRHLYPVVSATGSTMETRRSFVSLSTNAEWIAWPSATAYG
jgi:hypothetical protein